MFFKEVVFVNVELSRGLSFLVWFLVLVAFATIATIVVLYLVPNTVPAVNSPEFCTEHGFSFDLRRPLPDGLFYLSDGYSNNGDEFNSFWSADSVWVDDDGLSLAVTERVGETEKPFYSGEIRSEMELHWGLYSVVMKPPRVNGIVSSFFLFASNGDEIDIEFCGKEPKNVEFTYWCRGNPVRKTVELDFDTTADFHKYGFLWSPRQLVFFVDEVEVWRTRYELNTAMPKTPGRMMMNIWPGGSGLIGWLGELEADHLPAVASYRRIEFVPLWNVKNQP